MNWNIAIIVITLLLAAFATWREYQRASKAHLSWRILAAAVSVFALGCIVYPLTYSTTASTSLGSEKILLTTGFNPDSISKTDSVFTLDAAVHQQYPKSKILLSADELFTDSTHITPIHIYGYGLSGSALDQLNGKPVVFSPAPIPDGFTSINWTEKIKSGRQFNAQGAYKNTSGKALRLILKGLNTTFDSITIPAKSTAPFTLTSTPKATGRLVYNLIALSGKDTIKQEELPVIIEKNQPIKVLILSASPDFETKFLKNWLGSNGYGAASRSVISKGKYGQEYVNMDQPDLSHITPALLGKFDLVVGDLSELKNLSPPENSALQQQVTQKGLGLIIRADSSNKSTSWIQGGFRLSHQSGKQATDETLNIQGKGKTVKLSVDADYISEENNAQSIITDEHGHWLTGLAQEGAGRIVFTTVNHTYSWMLAGNKNDYTTLWSTLIDKALRRTNQAENWSVAGLPETGSAVELMSESSSIFGGVTIDQIVAYPSQNPAVPFQYGYTYWPRSSGWQQVSRPSGAPYWWYVWQKNGWLSLKAAKSTQLTSQYARLHPSDKAVTKQIQQKISAAVPKIYFYILFLVAAAFLWAESKFFS